jgi:hypothetical protein
MALLQFVSTMTIEQIVVVTEIFPNTCGPNENEGFYRGKCFSLIGLVPYLIVKNGWSRQEGYFDGSIAYFCNSHCNGPIKTLRGILETNVSDGFKNQLNPACLRAIFHAFCFRKRPQLTPVFFSSHLVCMSVQLKMCFVIAVFFVHHHHQILVAYVR